MLTPCCSRVQPTPSSSPKHPEESTCLLNPPMRITSQSPRTSIWRHRQVVVPRNLAGCISYPLHTWQRHRSSTRRQRRTIIINDRSPSTTRTHTLAGAATLRSRWPRWLHRVSSSRRRRTDSNNILMLLPLLLKQMHPTQITRIQLSRRVSSKMLDTMCWVSCSL